MVTAMVGWVCPSTPTSNQDDPPQTCSQNWPDLDNPLVTLDTCLPTLGLRDSIRCATKEKKPTEVKLGELPSWILMPHATPKGIVRAVQRGYDQYYRYMEHERDQHGVGSLHASITVLTRNSDMSDSSETTAEGSVWGTCGCLRMCSSHLWNSQWKLNLSASRELMPLAVKNPTIPAASTTSRDGGSKKWMRDKFCGWVWWNFFICSQWTGGGNENS